MIEYIVSVEHIERVNMTLLAFGRVKLDFDGMPEIVRCRDCVNAYSVSGETMLNCLHFSQWDYRNDEPGDWMVCPEGYCAWGERRES